MMDAFDISFVDWNTIDISFIDWDGFDMSFENWDAFVERTKAELSKDKESDKEKQGNTGNKTQKKRKPAATEQTGSLDRMN